MEYKYPANPSHVPADLTDVKASYRMKTVFAILGILFFLVCYLGMLAGFSYFTYAMFHGFWNHGGWWKLAAGIGGLMMVLFTLKFIFKSNNFGEDVTVEITADNHPKLYEFIHRVAEDTKGPKPNKILVNHDVNACVFFNSTMLSLFFPKRKNLLIGLGLVNGLNLSEFKAVIAHEFGHFSQSSMQVGSYVYMANKIIHDMIFERDQWDEILAVWRSVDLRLSFIAWIITPFIWLVRQLMFLIYKLINILHYSLSREMEFHADKVAVSICGSDAIVSSLWKLERAFLTWDSTLNYTGVASSQKIHTGNLFLHQKALLEEEREAVLKEINERKMDEHGHPIVFQEDDTFSSLEMYASHPSNKERELNAKTPYIQGLNVEESPWILFNDPQKIQETITKELYMKFMDLAPGAYYPDTERMVKFIAEERSTEQVFGEEYMGCFSERYLNIPEISAVQPVAGPADGEIRERFDRLVKEELPGLMKPVKEIDEKFQELAMIANGAKKARFFEYQGVKYKKKKFEWVAERMQQDRDALLHAPFESWDKEILQLSLAALDREEQGAQVTRIRMLDHFQKDLKDMIQSNTAVHMHFAELLHRNDVTEHEVAELRSRINNLVEKIWSKLEGNKFISFTPLPNIKTLEELLDMLGHQPLKKITEESFNNGEFETLVSNIDLLIYNYNRLIFKLISFLVKPLEALKDQSSEPTISPSKEVF